MYERAMYGDHPELYAIEAAEFEPPGGAFFVVIAGTTSSLEAAFGGRLRAHVRSSGCGRLPINAGRDMHQPSSTRSKTRHGGLGTQTCALRLDRLSTSPLLYIGGATTRSLRITTRTRSLSVAHSREASQRCQANTAFKRRHESG